MLRRRGELFKGYLGFRKRSHQRLDGAFDSKYRVGGEQDAMQMVLVTHLTEGCIVMSQLCYQGGEVFGRHETMERGTDI